MSAIRRTVRLTVRGAAIAVQAGAGLWGRVFGALGALAFSFLLFPVPFALFLAGRALERASRTPDRAEGGGTMMAGFCFGASLAVPVAAMVLGAMAVMPAVRDRDVAYPLLAALALVLGVAGGPFVSVAVHRLRHARDVEDAIGRALAASAIHGLAVAMGRGAMVTIGVAFPLVAAAALLALAPWGIGVVAFLVLVPVCTTWLAGVAVAAAEEDDAALADVVARPAPRRTHLWLGPSIALALLALAATLALFTPARAWTSLRGGSPCPDEVAEHGPHRVSVAQAGPPDVPPSGRSAYEVRTADGGGAGRILGPRGWSAAGVCSDGTGGGLWLRFTVSGSRDALGVPIDERGVRLDDGLLDRLASRIGPAIGALLLLSVVLLGRMAQLIGRRLALADRLSRAVDPLRSLTGQLAIEGSGPTFVASDGAHRFPVPASVTVLGAPAGPLPAGAVLTLIASEPLSSIALRTASAPWPATAVLVLGPVDEARTALLSALGRAAGPYAAAATVTLAVAALLLFGEL